MDSQLFFFIALLMKELNMEMYFFLGSSSNENKLE